ncbi:unnamed protein product [Ectocarpus sp. 6 AP-2014]
MIELSLSHRTEATTATAHVHTSPDTTIARLIRRASAGTFPTAHLLKHDHVQQMSQTRLDGGGWANKHAPSVGFSGAGSGSGGGDNDDGEVWLSCARFGWLCELLRVRASI